MNQALQCNSITVAYWLRTCLDLVYIRWIELQDVGDLAPLPQDAGNGQRSCVFDTHVEQLCIALRYLREYAHHRSMSKTFSC